MLAFHIFAAPNRNCLGRIQIQQAPSPIYLAIRQKPFVGSRRSIKTHQIGNPGKDLWASGSITQVQDIVHGDLARFQLDCLYRYLHGRRGFRSRGFRSRGRELAPPNPGD